MRSPPISRRDLGPLCLGAAAACLPGLGRAGPSGTLDDASRMNATPIASLTRYGASDSASTVDGIRREVSAGKASKRPVAAAGARHSMGGQSIPRDGRAIEFTGARVRVDRARMTYSVDGAARWRDVIAALDPHGLSPMAMQSNNDFGVLASICVNAHGWPVPFGPVAASVRSFRMILADGALVNCSRTERPNLFAAAAGGYGLVGILVSAELEAVPNALLRGKRKRMAAKDLGPALASAARSGVVRMAYARLSVAGDFLADGHLTVYVPAEIQPATLPGFETGGLTHNVARRVFRAQSGSAMWKAIRWKAEVAINPPSETRNALMSTPVALMEGTEPGRTDILHEYFLAPARLEEFLQACRTEIPPSGMDLLNVTLRFIAADTLSVLAYAPEDRVGVVMMFDQATTPEADAAMQALTRRLVDAALSAGGSFYLPYRLHATRDQVRRAYPRLGEFVALKRAVDPALVLRNALWDKFLGEQA